MYQTTNSIEKAVASKQNFKLFPKHYLCYIITGFNKQEFKNAPTSQIQPFQNNSLQHKKENLQKTTSYPKIPQKATRPTLTKSTKIPSNRGPLHPSFPNHAVCSIPSAILSI